MSALAETYLQQGRAFLEAGEAARAVGLLERARLLAKDDRRVLGDALESLADAYGATGDLFRSNQCRDQAARLRTGTNESRGSAPAPAAPPAQRRRMPLVLSIALLFVAAAVVALVGGVASYFLFRQAPVAAPTPAAHATTQPAGGGVAASPVVSPTASQPAPAKTSSLFPIDPAAERQALLRDSVGLVVMLIHYQGPESGRTVDFHIPISSGTAFAVTPSGIMLTNRHVVRDAKEKPYPPNLNAVGHPTLTRRGIDLLVCFGPGDADHFPAKLLHVSEEFDFAVLKIDRTFLRPLALADHVGPQGTEVFACGFPGVTRSDIADAQKVDVYQRWSASGHMNLLDVWTPDSFQSTLTKGIISAPERNIDGQSYVQFDAGASPGSSGGPLLNSDSQVLGIVTLAISTKFSGSGNYNFALQLEQLRDELGPYLKSP